MSKVAATIADRRPRRHPSGAGEGIWPFALGSNSFSPVSPDRIKSASSDSAPGPKPAPSLFYASWMASPASRLAHHGRDNDRHQMHTYIYYIAEKMPGAMEMQRFAHPIHVGLVTASDHEEAYTQVLENLRPTFADAPQLLEVRFEVVTPPRGGVGVWRHSKPIDTDITFTAAD